MIELIHVWAVADGCSLDYRNDRMGHVWAVADGRSPLELRFSITGMIELVHVWAVADGRSPLEFRFSNSS